MLRPVIWFLCWAASLALAAEPPLVAAAANLTHALTEIAVQYEQETGIRVKLSFGSSGNIARQILQGAPYQLFISADKLYVDMLTENGRPPVRNAEFARGRIGFFIPSDSRLINSVDVEAIIRTIEYDDYRKLVYANPEFAPYGKAAEQALASAGVWTLDRNKLLLGENVAQAVQFCLSGGVDLGIIPASDAGLPEVKSQGRFVLIPDQWYQPIQQYLALLSDTNPAAARFYDYLLGPAAQGILERYGYISNTVIVQP